MKEEEEEEEEAEHTIERLEVVERSCGCHGAVWERRNNTEAVAVPCNCREVRQSRDVLKYYCTPDKWAHKRGAEHKILIWTK